jgi:Fe-Mn family superoxide dismutase
MNQINDSYPFQLLPLPYPYDGLAPNISQTTLSFHHQKHLKTYVDNLNKALKPYPMYQTWPLEALVTYYVLLPTNLQTTIRNNAGGVFNHDFYFSTMSSERMDRSTSFEDYFEYVDRNYNSPQYDFLTVFLQTFHSYQEFKTRMKSCALKRFGSGYAWLVANEAKELSIVTTANQDTPLVKGLHPLLTIDVWEHAYYLDYQNRREDYIEHWFDVINWVEVTKNWGRLI